MGKVINAVLFFAQFIKNPRQLGSVIPSTGFLKRRISNSAKLSTANVVVELGPGGGGTTRHFLGAMKADATLLTIELNEGLYKLVSQIDDPRCIVHHGDALDLIDILQHYGLPAPDVVISGIPFSTMDPATGSLIVESIHRQLAPNGRFVAYQLSAQVARLATSFGDWKTLQLELLSIPPMRVWCWQ